MSPTKGSIVALSLLLLLAPNMCRADSLATLKERFDGVLAIQDGQLLLAGKSVAWSDVSYFVRDNAPATMSASGTIRLTNGEIWAAEITGFIGKKLNFESPICGTQRVDSALLSSVDFMRVVDSNATRAGTLYRDGAQPIPGEILWIDREKMGVNTALGSLTLSRDSVQRFVFAAGKQEVPVPLDEIQLRDGSIFKGKTELRGGNIELTHAILGKVVVPLSAVRSVQRHLPGIVKIEGFAPENVQCVPLLATKLMPEPAVGNEAAIWGVKVFPGTVVKIPLSENTKKTIFRASIKNVNGARGDAVVKISAGGKVLFEKTVSEGRGDWVSLDMPASSKDLEISVNFAGALRFPAGIVLSEAQIVSE